MRKLITAIPTRECLLAQAVLNTMLQNGYTFACIRVMDGTQHVTIEFAQGVRHELAKLEAFYQQRAAA